MKLYYFAVMFKYLKNFSCSSGVKELVGLTSPSKVLFFSFGQTQGVQHALIDNRIDLSALSLQAGSEHCPIGIFQGTRVPRYDFWRALSNAFCIGALF